MTEAKDAKPTRLATNLAMAKMVAKGLVKTWPDLTITAACYIALGWLLTYGLKHGFGFKDAGWVGVSVAIFASVTLGRLTLGHFARAVAEGFHAGTDNHNQRKAMRDLMASLEGLLSRHGGTDEPPADGGHGAYL